MGLFKILKALNSDKECNEKTEKEMEKYKLSNEEKEQVRKGYYQPDEFDRDDEEDSDED